MSVEGLSVGLFGAVTCSAGSGEIPLPPGKPSLLFALLALEAGHVVRVSAVIEAVWDGEPPSSARALVHTYVSALRRVLDVPGGPRIETRPGGYRLDCDPQVVDVHRLLVSISSDDLEVWEAALKVSTEPLLGGMEFACIEEWQVRVDAARDTLQDRIWANRLEAGRAAEVLSELRIAVEREPLHEERVLLFARALGQVGRIDEALRALDGYRRRLGEQLGMDPSPAVPALRQGLLTGSYPPAPSDAAPSAVKAPDPPTASTPSKARWRILVAMATAVAAITLVVWLWPPEPTTSDPLGDLADPALLTVDPTSGSVVNSVTLPISPTQIEASEQTVWVRSEGDQAVAAITLGSEDAAKVIGLTAPPSALALESDAAVVGLGFSGETVTVSNGRVSSPTPAVEGSAGRLTLAGSDNGVWVATTTGEVHAPPGTPGWVGPVGIGAAPRRLEVDGMRAWVITTGRAELLALRSGDAPPVRSLLRGEAVDLSVDGSQVWTVTSGDDRLWGTAPAGERVVTTRALPGNPTAVLAVGGTVWVAIAAPSSLVAFDARTLQPSTVVELPREPADLALVDGRLVIAVR